MHLDAASRVGVIALAITIAATTMCPEFHLLAWWDRSAVGRLLSRVLGAGGSWAAGIAAGTVCGVFGAQRVRRRTDDTATA